MALSIHKQHNFGLMSWLALTIWQNGCQVRTKSFINFFGIKGETNSEKFYKRTLLTFCDIVYYDQTFN